MKSKAHFLRIALVLMMTAILLPPAARAESPAVLLEKGIFAEETKGDINNAVKIYKQIVDEAGANRKYVAQAMYRLGVCYIKQKNNDAAIAAFRTVVEKFDGHKTLAARAAKHLSRLASLAGGQAVVLGYVDDSAESRRSIGGSGHAVVFRRAGRVKAVRIFASRYGLPSAPDEDFSVYLLDGKQKVIAKFEYPYARIARGEMTWYTLKTKPTAVPETFYVALSFSPHRTKGVYLGLDSSVEATHSYTGLPLRGFTSLSDKKDWMVRVELTAPPGAAPLVVRTTPRTFANDVDPKLKKMTVTFDSEMKDKCWSWTQIDPKSFPKRTGKISYDTKRLTCTMPVKLEAGKVYWVGINRAPWLNFMSTTRVPSKPYVILFATRSADGKPTKIPPDMLAEAKAINSAPLPQPTVTDLKFIPVPWKDGEVQRMGIKTPAGPNIGAMYYTARSVKAGGRSTWRLESQMLISGSDHQQLTRVDVDAGTCAPVSGMTWHKQVGECTAKYKPPKINWKIDGPDRKFSKTIDVDSAIYDNEQVIQMIRALPLKRGYRAQFKIFPVQSGVVCKCTIHVTGIEKVTVPAGTFECYRILLEVGYPGDKIKQILHYSTDRNRYFVKLHYEQRMAMELLEVGVQPADKGAAFSDKKLGISLSGPAGWRFYRDPVTRGRTFVLHLISPEMRMSGALTANARSSTILSARQLAEFDAEAVKKFLKGYKVRSDSWTAPKISGLDSVAYIADYKAGDREKVEYRIYALGKTTIHGFAFRIDKARFAKAKPICDSIIKSLKTSDKVLPVATPEQRAAAHLARRAWRLWNQRKLEEAEKLFKQAIEKDPRNSDAWNGLGWALQNQGSKSAAGAFKKSIELDPKNSGALNGLGWAAKRADKIEEAIAWWKKSIKAHKHASAAWNGLTRTYMEQGRYASAMASYAAWLQADPHNKQAREGLAAARTKFKDVAQPAEKAVAAVVEKWLALVDEGKYGESWDAASESLRKSVKKDKWGDTLKRLRPPLGKVVSRVKLEAEYRTALPGSPEGEYVVIIFKTTFANAGKKDAIETITPMKDKDGKWRVSGYNLK